MLVRVGDAAPPVPERSWRGQYGPRVVADQVSGASAGTAKRSRANTRARLLDGAYQVFAERGFSGATVELVCEAGGFTRGAFYSNFDSMEQLFLALWDRQADRIVGSLAELVADLERDPEAGESVPELLATFHPYDRQWFLVNTEFLLHALRNPPVAESLALHRRRLRDEIAKVIDLIPDIDARRQPPGIDRDTHTRLVIAAFEGCQNQGFVEPAVAEAGVLQQSMLSLLLSGAPAPGIVDLVTPPIEDDGFPAGFFDRSDPTDDASSTSSTASSPTSTKGRSPRSVRSTPSSGSKATPST